MTNEEKVLQFMKNYFDNVTDEQFAKDWAEIEALNLGGIPIEEILPDDTFESSPKEISMDSTVTFKETRDNFRLTNDTLSQAA